MISSSKLISDFCCKTGICTLFDEAKNLQLEILLQEGQEKREKAAWSAGGQSWSWQNLQAAGGWT